MENKIEFFKHILLQENQKQNLVSRSTLETEMEQHIADSREILDIINLAGTEIVDIGSGAGFPGLVLALYQPQAKLSLVESNVNKCRFLSSAVKELDLHQVSVLNKRVETLGQEPLYRNCFDLCTVRAVAAMNILLEYGLPLLKIQGKLILWKGPSWQEELKTAQTALELLGGKYLLAHSYQLEHDRARFLIVIEKIAPTPDKYPRRIGIPTKRPL